MKPSQSTFLDVRGLKSHIRTWGDASAPKLFLLHGYQDVSASWQFTVDAFERDWHVIAPDWRGYGLSEWSPAGCYWQPDLLADLEVILDHFEPELPAIVVAHSMGANIASLFAGLRADRVHKFVNIEGYGGLTTFAEDAPRRLSKWLQQMARGERQRPYDSYEEFAEVTRLVEQGLPVHVDRTFALSQYPEAIERLTNGEQLGKIVLRHDLEETS